ncbi:MAG: hypothetical protein LAP21_15470 [Acidobacteriia bacterium]|nr:hypothetical protein [Terriglobia bacterium]
MHFANSLLKAVVSAVAVWIVFAVGALPALAQATKPTGEYSVKFLCGTAGGRIRSVVPGKYATSINIHNPHFQGSGGIKFDKKFVRALPEEGPEPGASYRPSDLSPHGLEPDYAMEVDCFEIRMKLGLPPNGTNFIEGWVVIYTYADPAGRPEQLDVTAAYTVASLSGSSVSLEVASIAQRSVN